MSVENTGTEPQSDSRYPYTYAADYVRGLAGYNAGGTVLSRSDACQIRQGFAKALGMDDAELAQKLADYYRSHEVQDFIQVTGSGDGR